MFIILTTEEGIDFVISDWEKQIVYTYIGIEKRWPLSRHSEEMGVMVPALLLSRDVTKVQSLSFLESQFKSELH